MKAEDARLNLALAASLDQKDCASAACIQNMIDALRASSIKDDVITKMNSCG